MVSAGLPTFGKSGFLVFLICRRSARVDFSLFSFAEVRREWISRFSPLPRFGKPTGELFGLCRRSAKAIFPFWAFADVRRKQFFRFGHLPTFGELAGALYGLFEIPATSTGGGQPLSLWFDMFIISHVYSSYSKSSSSLVRLIPRAPPSPLHSGTPLLPANIWHLNCNLTVVTVGF